MSGTGWLRRLPVILIALTMLLTLAGCEEFDRALIKAFAEEWAKANAGKIAAWGALGTSGDETVDAILDAGTMIMNMEAADKVAKEGMDKRDITKIDQAINMRPGDSTYRTARGILLMEKGDPATARRDFDEADRLAKTQGPRMERMNLEHRMNQLGQMLPSLQGQARDEARSQLCNKDLPALRTISPNHSAVAQAARQCQ